MNEALKTLLSKYEEEAIAFDATVSDADKAVATDAKGNCVCGGIELLCTDVMTASNVLFDHISKYIGLSDCIADEQELDAALAPLCIKLYDQIPASQRRFAAAFVPTAKQDPTIPEVGFIEVAVANMLPAIMSQAGVTEGTEDLGSLEAVLADLKKDKTGNPNENLPANTSSNTKKSVTTTTDYTDDVLPVEAKEKLAAQLETGIPDRIARTKTARIKALVALRPSYVQMFPEGTTFKAGMKMSDVKAKFDAMEKDLITAPITLSNNETLTPEANREAFNRLREAVQKGEELLMYRPERNHKIVGVHITYSNVTAEGSNEGVEDLYVQLSGLAAELSSTFIGKVPTGEVGIGLKAADVKSVNTRKLGVDKKTVKAGYHWVGKNKAFEDPNNLIELITKDKVEGTDDERFKAYPAKSAEFFFVYKRDKATGNLAVKENTTDTHIPVMKRITGTVKGPVKVLRSEFRKDGKYGAAGFVEEANAAVVSTEVTDEEINSWKTRSMNILDAAYGAKVNNTSISFGLNSEFESLISSLSDLTKEAAAAEEEANDVD